jgi:hypothetical protein
MSLPRTPDRPTKRRISNAFTNKEESPNIIRNKNRNTRSYTNNFSSPNDSLLKKRIRINNTSSFNESYIEYLFTKIPVLNQDLLELIISYSNQSEKFKRKEFLDKITIKLRSDHKLGNLGPFNNLLNKVIVQNNKVIKSYSFKAKGLIEGVIHTTLCYSLQNIYTPSVNIIQKLNMNDRLHEVMNIAPGLSLEEYIMYLFNSDADNKKELMIYVLIKIAQNLLVLQNVCGFIHGDLNEQNIFINESDGSVLFIDFGRSTCRIPIYNTRTCILSTPVAENLSYKYSLDINNEPRLKAIDLFYLVEKLSRFRRNSFNNYEDFISIINEIKGNINVNSMNELFKFIYTDSFLGNPDIGKFYPENFINNLGTLLAGNPGSPAAPPI